MRTIGSEMGTKAGPPVGGSAFACSSLRARAGVFPDGAVGEATCQGAHPKTGSIKSTSRPLSDPLAKTVAVSFAALAAGVFCERTLPLNR